MPQRTHNAGEFCRQQQHAARIGLKVLPEGTQHGGRDGVCTEMLQVGKDQRHEPMPDCQLDYSLPINLRRAQRADMGLIFSPYNCACTAQHQAVFSG